MARFGDFKALCEQVPSYPWCNLFYRQVLSSPRTRRNHLTSLSRPQLLENSPSVLTGLSGDPSRAPVGVNPECGLRDGNIGVTVMCAVSLVPVACLIFDTIRRKAAVGAFLSILRCW